MRILLVSHGLVPDSVGGVEQHVAGLAAALVAAGHDVEIYARTGRPGMPQGAREQTVHGNPSIVRATYRWEGVDSLAAMYTAAPMAEALGAHLAERAASGVQFDVAHVHHLTGMSVDSLAVLAEARVPTVLTLHDYWLFCPRGQMYHHREERCETAPVARCAECLRATFPHWLAHDADGQVRELQQRALRALSLPQRLVVPSARAIPPFAALGVAAERFRVVENGVDLERLRMLPAPAFGPGPLRVGYFGTVMPSKGLHVLLEAMAGLPQELATLRVHGNTVPYHGDWSYATRCFARLEPGAGVTYHGPYSLAELPRLLADIDVLAAPALWHEAFGLTVREALAAGRPVLVSQVGGLQDAVTDGVEGRVLPPGDVGAWRDALLRLGRDRGELRRLARGCRDRARGFGAMAADLLEVYADANAAARSAASA